MPSVTIHYNVVLHETDRAVLLEIKRRPVWFPKAGIRFTTPHTAICAESLAQEKGVKYTPVYHHPTPLVPKPGQEPLNELLY